MLTLKNLNAHSQLLCATPSFFLFLFQSHFIPENLLWFFLSVSAVQNNETPAKPVPTGRVGPQEEHSLFLKLPKRKREERGR